MHTIIRISGTAGLRAFCLMVLCATLVASRARAADVAAAVVDEHGVPVPGASVSIYVSESPAAFFRQTARESELTQKAVTDSAGRFSWSPGPGATLVVITKPGLAPVWRTWSPTAYNSSEPLVMGPPAKLTGVVLDQARQPVPDAEVWLERARLESVFGEQDTLHDLSGKLARDLFSTRTGSDGHFVIDNLPAEAHASVVAAKSGKADKVPRILFDPAEDARPGQAPIEILLGPACRVEGKVTARETGEPIVGAQVQLQSTNGGAYPRIPVASGPGGVFSLADVPPDSYYVRARMAAERPEWLDVMDNSTITVAAGQVVPNVQVRMTRGTWLEVTVTATNTHEPVAGARVFSWESSAATDARGVARLRLTTNETRVSVSSSGWQPCSTNFTQQSGLTNHLLLQLAPAPEISGIVRDPAGQPVPGADVAFIPGRYPSAPAYAETTTDLQGRYHLPMQAASGGMFWMGPINLTNSLKVSCLKRNLAALREFVEPATNFDITLAPGLTLSGSVRNMEGSPISNAVISLRFETGGSYARVLPDPIRTGADGNFSIPALPQALGYMLDGIFASGYGSAYAAAPDGWTRTNHYEFPTFTLQRADRRLAGRVIGPDGQPFANAMIRVSRDVRTRNLNIRSDSAGRFEVNSLTEGEVQLYATGYGPGGATEMYSSAGSVRVQADDTNAEIALRAPNSGPVLRGGQNVTYTTITPGGGGRVQTGALTTTGTVLDPSGVAAPGVVLRIIGSSPLTPASYTDGYGHYTLTWRPLPRPTNLPTVASSPYVLARDLGRNQAATRELDQPVTNLDLTLHQAIAASGIVQETDGKPVADARVVIMMSFNRRTAAIDTNTTDSQGGYFFNALPPEGTFTLTVSAPHHGTITRVPVTLTISPSNTAEFPPVQLSPANLRVAGVLLDTNDAPVAGVTVNATGQGQAASRAQTDASGHFQFDEIAEGQVRLSATRVNRAPANNGVQQPDFATLTVQSGDTNVVLKFRPR